MKELCLGSFLLLTKLIDVKPGSESIQTGHGAVSLLSQNAPSLRLSVDRWAPRAPIRPRSQSPGEGTPYELLVNGQVRAVQKEWWNGMQ